MEPWEILKKKKQAEENLEADCPETRCGRKTRILCICETKGGHGFRGACDQPYQMLLWVQVDWELIFFWINLKVRLLVFLENVGLVKHWEEIGVGWGVKRGKEMVTFQHLFGKAWLQREENRQSNIWMAYYYHYCLRKKIYGIFKS